MNDTASQGAPEKLVQDRLARLQAQLDLLKAQVRQAQQLSSLGTAAAMMAHEVNNLLTPVISYAKAALDAQDTELYKKALSVTVKNVQMLILMSERVLEIGAAKPTKKEVVPLHTVVEEAAASLCRDLSKDGISFTVEVDESLTAWADPLQLRQVLFNLFLNAREAMAPSHGGQLKVSGDRHNNKVVINVRNTGETIPPELLPYIFDPFQSGKTTGNDKRARCTGLGLALCRELIEENGGSISVTSSPGAGTAFTIELPLPERQGVGSEHHK